jgi:hypothetical protein
MTADGFVNILDGDGMTFKFARGDRAAIENEARNIQPCESHDAGGDGLVASNQNNQSVEHISPSDQLDGVGDDFAADQRGTHTFRAHGDAVGDRNGIEFKWSAAGGANAVLNVHGKLAEVKVAGAYLNPGICNANERLGEVVIPQAAGAQHGARSGTIRAVRKCAATRLQQ